MATQIKIFRGSLEKDVNEFCKQLSNDPNTRFKNLLFQDSNTCVIVYEDNNVGETKGYVAPTVRHP